MLSLSETEFDTDNCLQLSLSSSTASIIPRPPSKPLFTLQHSSTANLSSSSSSSSSSSPSSLSSSSSRGNDVSSVCFLPKVQPRESDDYCIQESTSDSDSDSDSDADVEIKLRSREILSARSSYTQHQSNQSDNHIHIHSHSDIHFHAHTSTARDVHSALSFADTFLASTHANGNAYIWDLASRRVIHTIDDTFEYSYGTNSNRNSRPGPGPGPGLALGIVNMGMEDMEYQYMFHQRRDEEGSISILDPCAGYKVVRRMECHSKTFCHATSGSGSGCDSGSISGTKRNNDTNLQQSIPRDLLLSPSQHPSFAQLWDLRVSRSVGVVHGAKLDQQGVSKWNDEGMLMSLQLSHGNSYSYSHSHSHSDHHGRLHDHGGGGGGIGSGGYCNIACGMESGKVFFHDLRMLKPAAASMDSSGQNTSHSHSNSDSDSNSNSNHNSNHNSMNHGRAFITRKDVIDSTMCSVSLGKDPILCLDMCRSDKDTNRTRTNNSIGETRKKNHDCENDKLYSHGHRARTLPQSQSQSQSMIIIAGKAADAMEQLDLSEEERGTVAVIKATTMRDYGNDKDANGDADDDDDDDDDESNCTDYGNIRMKARVRAMVETCKISNELSREGKPGVGVCRFRPDGNVFAVGGWDKRVRIYSRTSAKLLSILKGSDASVTSLDWSKRSVNGDYVLAAGSSDGKIALWRCE